uniref:Tc1-like transposase DDE domain-containing protein n=1 Tax=Globisporangium ultimum (strain ATCC 200006 / CBS 805.95 / DAOM BR144) TaxID=431595 RepID=K3XCE9_GLOUD
MDNAKYHKVLPATTPKRGSKKEVLFNACQQYGIAVPSNATKPILWEVLSKYINKSVAPVVVEMARAEGHDMVYTPPHHFDLQPIEIVWSIVKGDVGRQYTTSTTFADILTRLDDAFRRLQSSTVQGCTDTAKKQLFELKKHLEAMDAQNESSGDDAECDSDSGGSDGGSDLD